MSDDEGAGAPQSDPAPHAPRPRTSRDDYLEVVSLTGENELIAFSKLGCPLTARRLGDEGWEYRDEYLYLAPGRRHILVLLLPCDDDPELVPLPWPVPQPARELTGQQAASWYLSNEYEPPDWLRIVIGDDPSQSAGPPGSGLDLPAKPQPVDFDALAEALLRERQVRAASLVKFMKDRSTATFQDVMDKVHGGDRSEGTIRALVNRTNNLMQDQKSRLSFSTKSSQVIRHIDFE